MKDGKEILYRLCTAMLESGIPMKDLAERTEIHVNTLYHYTNGTMPCADKLGALCGALGVSADWVLGLKAAGPENAMKTAGNVLGAWEPCEKCRPKCLECARLMPVKQCGGCENFSRFVLYEGAGRRFCPQCGRPLTQEAREEWRQRWEGR